MLHYQVEILGVIVGLQVAYDIRMVKFSKNLNLLKNLFDIFRTEFCLIYHPDRYFSIRVWYIAAQEHFLEIAVPQ